MDLKILATIILVPVLTVLIMMISENVIDNAGILNNGDHPVETIEPEPDNTTEEVNLLPPTDLTPKSFLSDALFTLNDFDIIQSGSDISGMATVNPDDAFDPEHIFNELHKLFATTIQSPGTDFHVTINSIKIPYTNFLETVDGEITFRDTLVISPGQISCSRAPSATYSITGSATSPNSKIQVDCKFNNFDGEVINTFASTLRCTIFPEDPHTIHCQYSEPGEVLYKFAPFSVTGIVDDSGGRFGDGREPADNSDIGIIRPTTSTGDTLISFKYFSLCAFVLTNNVWSFTEPMIPLLVRLGVPRAEIPNGVIDLVQGDQVNNQNFIPEEAHVMYASKQSRFQMEVPELGFALPEPSSQPAINARRVVEDLVVGLVPDKKFSDLLKAGRLGYMSEITYWERTSLIWFNAIDMIFRTINEYFYPNSFSIGTEPMIDDSKHFGTPLENLNPPVSGYFTEIGNASSKARFKPVQVIVQNEGALETVIFPGSIALERGQTKELPVYVDIRDDLPINTKTSELDIEFTALFQTAAAKPVASFSDEVFTRVGDVGTEHTTINQISPCEVRIKIENARLVHKTSSNNIKGLIHLGNLHVEGLAEGSNVIQIDIHQLDTTDIITSFNPDTTAQPIKVASPLVPTKSLSMAKKFQRCQAPETDSYLPAPTSGADTPFGMVLVLPPGILPKEAGFPISGGPIDPALSSGSSTAGIQDLLNSGLNITASAIPLNVSQVSLGVISRDDYLRQGIKVIATGIKKPNLTGLPDEAVDLMKHVRNSFLIRVSLMWRDIAEFRSDIKFPSHLSHNVSIEQLSGITFPTDKNMGFNRGYPNSSVFPVDKSYIILKARKVSVDSLRLNAELADIKVVGDNRGSTLALIEPDYVNALDLLCNFIRKRTHVDSVNLVHFLTGQDMVRMSHTEMGDALSEYPGKNVDFMGIAEGIGGVRNLHKSISAAATHLEVETSVCPKITPTTPVLAGDIAPSQNNMTEKPGYHSLTQHSPNINTLGSSYQPLKIMDLLLIAHELGHNFGAWHDDEDYRIPLEVVYRTTFGLGPIASSAQFKPIMTTVLDKEVLPIFSHLSTVDIQEKVLCVMERPIGDPQQYASDRQNACDNYDLRVLDRKTN